MSAAPTPESHRLARKIDRALARMHSGDPALIVYRAACRFMAHLKPGRWYTDLRVDLEGELAGVAEDALAAAGHGDLDVLDFWDEINAALEGWEAAVSVAAVGGGTEDYRAAQAFRNAAAWTERQRGDCLTPPPQPRSRGCHRRAPGTSAPRRRNSRRTTARAAGGGSSGSDDDGESEPPRLTPGRHLKSLAGTV